MTRLERGAPARAAVRRVIACLTIPLLAAVGTTCGGATGPRAGHLILFMGNSLFGQNDLPGTVVAIAAQDTYPIVAVSDVQPGTALIDHVIFQYGPAAIRRQRWDYVVMQQGPSQHQVCRDTLVLALQELNPLIRAVGATPAVFMSWPAAADSANGGFDRVRESFQTGAKAIGAVFIPAGEAWRIAWRADPTLPLYGDDGYHPGALGTYLSALVIYEKVTGHDARDLPPVAVLAAGPLPVPEETVVLLQRAAHEANTTYGAGQVPGLPPIPDPRPITC